MKKLSIKQLAKELNISTATISYVINGKAREKRISEELEERIQKYVKEHNYIPNHQASSLRSGKTKIICLMVEDIADVFFAGVAGLIEQIAYDKGYKIIYCSTKNDTAKTKELISTFFSRNVDGYIITPPNGIEKDIKSLLNEKIPVVTFDRYLNEPNVSYVGMDNLDSSYKATKHLLEQGFKNIAFITLESNQSQMHERLEGYEKAINEAGKKTIIEKIDYAQRHEELPVTKIVELLQTDPNIDALYFATNYLAVSGLKAINKVGLKLGENIGMVVFDDSDLFMVHQPTITAVAQPIESMSVQLINILLSHLEKVDAYTPQKVIVPGELIIRESSIKR
jgi:LacI family transcriptional regulator